MHIKIFHNPRCSKSRQTLALLGEQNAQPEVVEYLNTPPTADEIREIVGLLGIKPRDLLRRGEDEYRALGLDNPTLDDEAIIAAMTDHPRLIERPIVIVDGQRAVIGRPPEKVLEILP